MIKKYYSDLDVVTVARKRIKNIFESANKIQLSVSGGKDSITLNDLIFKMCASGEIDKSKLIVDFIDEEAIYPCVEQIAKNIRLQWLSIGVEFRWWCIECKHYNCFNMLTNDESFICWDRYKKDVWVREMPKFAITNHPLLNRRKDTYQEFLTKLNKDRVQLIGLRVSESMQRMNVVAKQKDFSKKLYPIYDMTDKDVWRYIRDNNLEIPDAYIKMYQCGIAKNRMRISQFFSVDTAASLVKMCEYYPHLFDKICKREPNAYMAMLYYDTELFRKQKKEKQVKKDEQIDYKAKCLELIMNDDYFQSPSAKQSQRRYKRLILLHGSIIINNDYKKIYNALVGGDPKNRAYRAIMSNIFKEVSNNG